MTWSDLWKDGHGSEDKMRPRRRGRGAERKAKLQAGDRWADHDDWSSGSGQEDNAQSGTSVGSAIRLLFFKLDLFCIISSLLTPLTCSTKLY